MADIPKLIPNRLYQFRHIFTDNLFVFEYSHTEIDDVCWDEDEEPRYVFMGRGMRISPQVDPVCSISYISSDEFLLDILPESVTMQDFLDNKPFHHEQPTGINTK